MPQPGADLRHLDPRPGCAKRRQSLGSWPVQRESQGGLLACCIMFSARELRRRGASARVIQRISRKQRGARSGSAGYRQEDFFAVSQMVAAARRFLDNGEHFWMIQNAAALVDDVVTENGTHHFFQLKTSPGITWNPVSTDFRDQADLCRLFGIHHYKLVLVVPSKADRARLARERPRTLKRASVLWFPRMSRTGDLARSNSPIWRT